MTDNPRENRALLETCECGRKSSQLQFTIANEAELAENRATSTIVYAEKLSEMLSRMCSDREV